MGLQPYPLYTLHAGLQDQISHGCCCDPRGESCFLKCLPAGFACFVARAVLPKEPLSEKKRTEKKRLRKEKRRLCLSASIYWEGKYYTGLPECAFVIFAVWCFSPHLASQALTLHPKPSPLIPSPHLSSQALTSHPKSLPLIPSPSCYR